MKSPPPRRWVEYSHEAPAPCPRLFFAEMAQPLTRRERMGFPPEGPSAKRPRGEAAAAVAEGAKPAAGAGLLLGEGSWGWDGFMVTMGTKRTPYSRLPHLPLKRVARTPFRRAHKKKLNILFRLG